jgi:hypothetical protein
MFVTELGQVCAFLKWRMIKSDKDFINSSQTDLVDFPFVTWLNDYLILLLIFFHRKYPKNFRASLRLAQFFSSTPLTLNPGSALGRVDLKGKK